MKIKVIGVLFLLVGSIALAEELYFSPYDVGGNSDAKVATISGKIGDAGAKEVKKGLSLFETAHPTSEWATFRVAGYDKPVTGVIYRKDKPATNGCPLGGLDTGCIDVETSGLWGYTTIYNTHVPRRGQLNVPILGLSCAGQTWVLCDPSQTKKPVHWGSYYDGAPKYPDELTHEPTQLDFSTLKTPQEIHYYGHYPVIDMEYEMDAPVSVGVRAWSPFYPGHIKESMIPGFVYEVHLRNTSKVEQTASLAFNFPGPLAAEAGGDEFERQMITRDVLKGMLVKSPKVNYLVGAIDCKEVVFGKDLGSDAAVWGNIATVLPKASKADSGTAVKAKVVLKAGQKKVVRFLVTWLCPQWKGGSVGMGCNWANEGGLFTHQYAAVYPDPVKTAELLVGQHESLLRRIIDWQSVIYTEKSLPGWLQDSLINSLYMITEDGMWAQAKDPIPDWVRSEDGLFGMNECPRGCPQIECVPCSFYGSMPIVYFFREAALSTLRGHKGYQKENGDATWTFSGLGKIGFANANHGFQTTTNGISYMSMVDRYRLCWPSEEFDKEFYESIKKNTIFTMGLRPIYEIGDAIISMPRGNYEVEGLSAHWFEAPEPGWYGMVPHVGGLHLAQIKIAQRMAEKMGDREFANQCQQWFEAGSKSLEEKTWLGTHYLVCWEPESSRRSEQVFAYQLDGEWVADFHGLEGGVFPKDRIDIVLETIKRCNVAMNATGASNYANLDGTPADVPGYGNYSYFPPELIMLAMNYLYAGQKEFGMELAERCWKNLICTWGYTWEMPNFLAGDKNDGEKSFGEDYYQNMIIWSMPAAMDGVDFGTPCQKGGLVDRICKAAGK